MESPQRAAAEPTGARCEEGFRAAYRILLPDRRFRIMPFEDLP